MLSKNPAQDWAIRVNAICPELVDTPLALAMGEEVMAELRASQSVLTPDEIADCVVALIDDDSRSGAIMKITKADASATSTDGTQPARQPHHRWESRRRCSDPRATQRRTSCSVATNATANCSSTCSTHRRLTSTSLDDVSFRTSSESSATSWLPSDPLCPRPVRA